MTDLVAAIEEPTGRAAPASDLRDYWVLTKPNVMKLVVFTGAVGLYLAPASPHPLLAFVVILAIAAGAAASAAINNSYDADIDAVMARTRRRPTARGVIPPAEALTVGVTLAILSVIAMFLAGGALAAALLAATIGYYVFVYTLWLKRKTPQNIVIGGAAGAFPPMIGWAAATGSLGVLPICMFAIVFFWTPPHSWALALYRRGDYQRAGVPMLPVAAGEDATRRQISAYTYGLIPVVASPWLLGELGVIYAVISTALGVGFALAARRLEIEGGEVAAMRTFKLSILHLFGVFSAMVVDHALEAPTVFALFG